MIAAVLFQRFHENDPPDFDSYLALFAYTLTTAFCSTV